MTVSRRKRKGETRCFKCVIKSPDYREKQQAGFKEAQAEGRVVPHNKGVPATSEERQRLSQQSKAAWTDPETSGRMRAAIRKRSQDEGWLTMIRRRAADPVYRANMAMTLKESYSNPEVRDRHLLAMRSISLRERLRTATLVRWQDPDYAAAMSTMSQQCWANPEYRERLTGIVKANWDNPEVRRRHLEAMADPELQHRLQSYWDDPVWVERFCAKSRELGATGEFKQSVRDAMQSEVVKAKMAVARANQPVVSSLNKAVFAILDSLGIKWASEHPIGPWNFDVWVPDHNLLIECHGEYWHGKPAAGPRDKAKATYVERYCPGVRLAVIWELEFHTEGRVLHRIKEMLGLADKPALHEVDFKALAIREITFRESQVVYSRHYLGSSRGKQHLGLFSGETVIGACSFGPFQRNEQTLKYKDAVELTRFWLDPAYQVKNLGSWFLSRCLKLSGQDVVTYADTTMGHSGGLYRASNFRFSHTVAPDYYYVDQLGWVVHKRTVWGRAQKMSTTEAAYAETNLLRKVWGSEKLCFIYHKR